MTDVLTAIVRAYGRDLDHESSLKIRRYLSTLSSAGRANSRELAEYGLAYLRELEKSGPAVFGLLDLSRPGENRFPNSYSA